MEVRERSEPSWVELSSLKRGDVFKLGVASLVYMLFESTDGRLSALCLQTSYTTDINMDRMVIPVTGYFQVEEG